MQPLSANTQPSVQATYIDMQCTFLCLGMITYVYVGNNLKSVGEKRLCILNVALG